MWSLVLAFSLKTHRSARLLVYGFPPFIKQWWVVQ
jgi:hypothetical protein